MPKTLPCSSIVQLALLISLACASCTSESAPPDGDWPTAYPETQGFDSAEIAAVIEEIAANDLAVDSLLVIRNGVLIVDAYFYPYLGDRPHDLASVTKSVTSTLVGIAIDQGLLTLDQNLVASFPDVVSAPPTDGKEDIVLQHLLTMTSGLDCNGSQGEQQLNAMLGSENFVEFALGLPMAMPPGDQFAYCSPGSHLMSAMIGDASGMSALDFAWNNLFQPLGIGDAVWPTDPQGVNRGWGDLRLHPRDLARLGQLFLNGGEWNGRRVVSKEWVDEASRAHVVVGADGESYGYQWWIPGGDFEGVYEARGRGGQGLVVWPEANVVAVFTGRGVDIRGEVALALAATLKSDTTLPANPDAHARLDTAIQNAVEPPLAHPVPALPAMAEEVSGKVYRLEPNQFDVNCIALRFDSDSEVWFDLSLGGGDFELPVGMDGVPRFSEDGPTGIPVGVLGEWTEPSVFSMQYDELAGPNHLRIRGDFGSDAETVALEFTDPGDYFPTQTVPGSAVPSCE